MTRRNPVRAPRTHAARILVALATCFISDGARAQDDNAYHDLTTLSSEVEAGFLWDSTDSYRFGDYTGLDDRGFYPLGNVDINRRSPYDADSPWYFSLDGQNLGLDSRYVDSELKRPGLFGLHFIYNEMPKLNSDSYMTFMKHSGSEHLVLPPGWVPGNNPSPGQMPSLQGDLNHSNLDYQRRTLGGGASLVLPKGFDFDASYTHETKTGHRSMAAVLGTSGGNPRSFLTPEPVDYVTHQIDSHVRYTSEALQLQLEYYASGFTNENDRLTWQNPYLPATGSRGWPNRGNLADPTDGYPGGQKGQMPDNWFHQVSGSGGLKLPLNSRLVVNTAYGWMRQHDDFLPYTTNPFIATPLGLPGDDLNGKVDTKLVNVQFTTNPVRNLDAKVAYRWSNRDNDTNREKYYRVANDTGDQVGLGEASINRPYSFKQHKVDAELGYRFFDRTKLSLLYQWERTERNYQEVSRNDEVTFGAKLVSRANRYLNGGVRYERSYRDGSNYNCVKPAMSIEETPSPNLGCPTMAASGLEFENQPQMRKYYMANLRRDEMYAWVNILPTETVNIGLNFRWDDDDYYDSTYGLTNSRGYEPSIDVGWVATDDLNFHAFYTYENLWSELKSIQWTGTAPDQAFDPANKWSSRDKDIIHTVGAGIEYRVIPDRLTLGTEYLFAKSRGKIATHVGSGLTMPAPFPANNTTLHDVSVYGNLQITRNVSMRIGYLFERFRSNDWATDQLCPACLSSSSTAAAIASGEQSPNYTAHVVSWSMKFEFW